MNMDTFFPGTCKKNCNLYFEYFKHDVICTCVYYIDIRKGYILSYCCLLYLDISIYYGSTTFQIAEDENVALVRYHDNYSVTDDAKSNIDTNLDHWIPQPLVHVDGWIGCVAHQLSCSRQSSHCGCSLATRMEFIFETS